MSKLSWRRVFITICQIIFLVITVDGLTRNMNDQAGWLGLFGLILSFLPDTLRKFAKLTLPFTYEAAMMFFIFFSLIAGEYFNLYGTYWWWDDMLHFVSGLVIGYIALLILHIDDARKKAVSGHWYAAIFVFSLVLMSAAVWEIFEFTVDQTAHGHMQYGLTDTMVDIIDAGVGGAIMAALGLLYYKFSRGRWLRGMFDAFIRLNPWVVKR